MEKENLGKEKFEAPEFLDAPFLTEEYIKEKGWYPVRDEWLENGSPSFVSCGEIFVDPRDKKLYKRTSFGPVPCKSRSEFKEGDIVIAENYKGRDITEKFYRIERLHLEAYEKGLWNLLPNAVIVHQPERQE
jgi:hypothetical protein